jgi:hypothetical protein
MQFLLKEKNNRELDTGCRFSQGVYGLGLELL